MSLSPRGGMGANWVTESFEDDFAEVLEAEPLANAEFGNRAGYDDLFRCSMLAQPAGQLNCRSKQIVMLLDRFPGCGADSDLERPLEIRLRVLVQLALNLNGAANRSRRRDE